MSTFHLFIKSLLTFVICIQALEGELLLSDFKQSSSIWIGSEKIDINYEHQKSFSLNSKSRLKLHIQDDQWVTKGTLVATIEPERIKRDKASYQLELKQAELLKQELHEEIEEQWNQQNQKQAELESELIKLQFLSEENLSETNKKRLNLATRKLKKQIVKLQQKFSVERKELKITLFEDEQKLALERKKSDLDSLKHISEIRAPFDSKIIYLSNEIVLGKSVWIDTPGEIFTMTNVRKVILSCSPVSQQITSLNPSKTKLTLLNKNRLINAHFLDEKNTSRAGRNYNFWRFTTKESLGEEHPEIIGSSQLGNLFYNLDQPGHVIPKNRLVDLYPEILEDLGWEGVVKKLWPQAHVMYVSPRFVIVRP